jgi:glycopeptide antibiotics resistance protein
LPDFVSTYAGDTLWALMVFWVFCIFAPKSKTWKVSLTALLFSFAIEFSQFYHAAWIDSIRETRLGGLVLGFGFKFSDLICYSAGVLLAAIIRCHLTKNQSKKPILPKYEES